tara:strand:- start:624 stop:872 length:249 start_codon:yes stop_codon:yes gene_type:complete
MCIFRIKTETTAGAPAITPRQDQSIGLPDAKPTKDTDKIASVQYGGGSKKDRGSSGANKTGTDALKINIDENPGAGSGGINV